MNDNMISHLSADKRLKRIIDVQAEPELHRKKNVYLHLCASIMSQQLSTKVADIILRRFLELFGKKEPTAQQILDMPFEKLRGIGLSNAKAHYVQNVCRFFIEEKITDAKLYKMKEDEAITYLSQIKGVGKWTVEMILMFTLGREDVFAVDDLGIQQAMCALYRIDPTDKKKMKEKMLKLSSKWSPYRTYACMYLWRYKDSRPKT